MRFRWITLIAAAVAVASALAAGCGSSDEDDVTDAASSFAEAGAVNDYDTFCALLTAPGKEGIEDFARTRLDAPDDELCQAGLEATGGLPSSDAETEVTDVSVDGDSAEATVTNTIPGEEPITQTLQLQRQESGEWLIADYGGSP